MQYIIDNKTVLLYNAFEKEILKPGDERMKLFEKKIKDERIENMQNKFFKDAYLLAVVISVVSMGVKTYIFSYDLRQFLPELAVIIIPSLYYGIRIVMSGVYWAESEMKASNGKLPLTLKNFLIGIAIGVMISLFFGVRSSILYGSDGNRLYYFLLVFFASMTIYTPVFVMIVVLPDLIGKRMAMKLDRDNDIE